VNKSRFDAARFIKIIDERVRKLTRSMGMVETTWGEVAAVDLGAKTVDVYLYGSATASEDFRVRGGAVPTVGSVVKVAIDKGRGDRWVEEPVLAVASTTGDTLDHADLTNVTANQHHNQAHAVTGLDHTTSETDTSKRLAPDGAGGVSWAAGGGGAGHTIKEDGTVRTTRAGLNFTHGLDATDDAGNDETDVSVDESELDHSLLGGTTTHAADTLSPTNLDIPSTASPAQTAEGRAVWDSDDDKLTVGTGAGRKTLVNEGALTASGLTMATDRLLGRTTASTGAVEELTVGTGLVLASGSLSATAHTIDLNYIIDGGSATLVTGIRPVVRLPRNCTVTAARAYADQNGSIQIDVLRTTHSDYDMPSTHPVAGDSIIGAGTDITISSADKYEDTSLDWDDVTLQAGDLIAFNVISATTIRKVTISLELLLA
jgi:hypothetical protein